MDTLQASLGQALLVLMGLAVVLLALILLLIEANYIVHLGGKLAGRFRTGGSDSGGSSSPTSQEDDAERPHGDGEAE